jgi:hypothetical protein
VCARDAGLVVEVGERLRDATDACCTAAGEKTCLGVRPPRVGGLRVEGDESFEGTGWDLGVAPPRRAAEPCTLASDRTSDAAAHDGRRLTGTVAGFGGLDDQSEVEAVEQWCRQATQVAGAVGISASACGRTPPTRAGVGARHQEEVGGEAERECLARDAHDSLLERLSECIERARWELAELVEE